MFQTPRRFGQACLHGLFSRDSCCLGRPFEDIAKCVGELSYVVTDSFGCAKLVPVPASQPFQAFRENNKDSGIPVSLKGRQGPGETRYGHPHPPRIRSYEKNGGISIITRALSSALVPFLFWGVPYQNRLQKKSWYPYLDNPRSAQYRQKPAIYDLQFNGASHTEIGARCSPSGTARRAPAMLNSLGSWLLLGSILHFAYCFSG